MCSAGFHVKNCEVKNLKLKKQPGENLQLHVCKLRVQSCLRIILKVYKVCVYMYCTCTFYDVQCTSKIEGLMQFTG